MKKTQIAQLIRRAQKGDTEAFAQIYSLYFNSVYYLALKLTKNEHDAKDAAQDTMLKLYKNILNVSTQKSLNAYINKIAYNCSVDLFRKRKVLLGEEEDSSNTLQQIADEDEEFIPHRFLEDKEAKELLQELIGELNDTLKPVIILFYYNELSIKEIARVLDIQETAVKKRLVRGRESLKKQIEQYDHRKEVFRVLSLPILTQVMREEAEAMCYNHVKYEIWQNFCRNAQIAETSMLAATPIVLGQVTVASRRSGRYQRTLIFVGAVAILALVLSYYMEIAKVAQIANESQSMTSKDILLPGNTDDFSNDSIALGPSGRPSNGDIASPPEAASSGVDQQHWEVIPDLRSSGPDSPEGNEETGGWNDTMPSRPVDPGNHAGSDEATDWSHPAAVEDTGEETSMALVFPQMWLATNVLSYPAGTQLTKEQVLEDAGGYAFDKYGRESELTVVRLDSVNVNYPGQYSVYIQTVGHDPLLGVEVIIIIT